MTLFIINKSTLITERLVLLVNEADNVDAVFTASTFREAITLMQAAAPDIVLLDMNLPKAKSVELIKIIKQQNSKIFFIVLFDEVNDIKKQYCEYLGVSFIFDKYHDVEKIIPAINSFNQ